MKTEIGIDEIANFIKNELTEIRIEIEREQNAEDFSFFCGKEIAYIKILEYIGVEENGN